MSPLNVSSSLLPLFLSALFLLLLVPAHGQVNPDFLQASEEELLDEFSLGGEGGWDYQKVWEDEFEEHIERSLDDATAKAKKEKEEKKMKFLNKMKGVKDGEEGAQNKPKPSGLVATLPDGTVIELAEDGLPTSVVLFDDYVYDYMDPEEVHPYFLNGRPEVYSDRDNWVGRPRLISDFDDDQNAFKKDKRGEEIALKRYKKFLNAKNTFVLPSGVAVRFLRLGEGDRHASPMGLVRMNQVIFTSEMNRFEWTDHYITVRDVFNMTADPNVFKFGMLSQPLGKTIDSIKIPGLKELYSLMVQGDRLMFYIPWRRAFGAASNRRRSLGSYTALTGILQAEQILGTTVPQGEKYKMHQLNLEK
eukprot:TRINITY_DN5727_c0_g1_i1.p1 TRINITY_DN5727_c0_g1~~TRINITY_DN5727_c0_g1_i1.p1  ORF type:complete len:380 (+),score=114.92 TRINITY_DN5727_c0_g1_i1:60-1142(+)